MVWKDASIPFFCSLWSPSLSFFLSIHFVRSSRLSSPLCLFLHLSPSLFCRYLSFSLLLSQFVSLHWIQFKRGFLHDFREESRIAPIMARNYFRIKWIIDDPSLQNSGNIYKICADNADVDLNSCRSGDCSHSNSKLSRNEFEKANIRVFLRLCEWITKRRKLP